MLIYTFYIILLLIKEERENNRFFLRDDINNHWSKHFYQFQTGSVFILIKAVIASLMCYHPPGESDPCWKNTVDIIGESVGVVRGGGALLVIQMFAGRFYKLFQSCLDRRCLS